MAADPSKQRWVVASGMLSLLQRLVAQLPSQQPQQQQQQQQQFAHGHDHHHHHHQQQQQQQQRWQSGLVADDVRPSTTDAVGTPATPSLLQPQSLQEVPQLCLKRQVRSTAVGVLCVSLCVFVLCVYVYMCVYVCSVVHDVKPFPQPPQLCLKRGEEQSSRCTACVLCVCMCVFHVCVYVCVVKHMM